MECWGASGPCHRRRDERVTTGSSVSLPLPTMPRQAQFSIFKQKPCKQVIHKWRQCGGIPTTRVGFESHSSGVVSHDESQTAHSWPVPGPDHQMPFMRLLVGLANPTLHTNHPQTQDRQHRGLSSAAQFPCCPISPFLLCTQPTTPPPRTRHNTQHGSSPEPCPCHHSGALSPSWPAPSSSSSRPSS